MLIRCKEGWCVGSGRMGVAWGWEDCGDGTEKKGGETDFQKEGQTGSRGGCLKKEGWGGTSLWTMGHCAAFRNIFGAEFDEVG